jgi:hypothetical protein
VERAVGVPTCDADVAASAPTGMVRAAALPRCPGRLAALSLAACFLIRLDSALAQAPQAGVEPAAARDGSHDFDSEIGEWTTHLKRLQHPLSGSTQWVEYDGTSTVKSLLGGRANVVELGVQGSAGRIEGLSLRLYEPESHQWTLNFANVADGHLTPPVIGEFRDGRGQFYAQDSFKGRAILVRFIISKLGTDSYRFEQAFSSDGGQSWEINWIATDTRRRH